MTDLPPGWMTDLFVLRHTGALIEDRGDHLVIRSPQSPRFHWGNCLLVTDDEAIDDAGRWLDTFGAAFPAASWVAIGLARMPDDTDAWNSRGVQLELDAVLTTRSQPRQTPPPEGYTFRRLSGSDWDAYVARQIAENDRTGEYEPESHAIFSQDQTRIRRDMSERGVAAFFGAFADDVLVADLGIVVCDTTARYQAVGTDEDHRAHGLASHLLGVAADWSAEQGCDRWVIVTEATNPAGRVYRRAGFEPDIGNVQAYRKPPLD
jgi:GNAT superfamily N-acetyltransferase